MSVRPTLGHRAGRPYRWLVRINSVISVITAVHPATVGHLRGAHASLAAQILPPGWSWEWLLQEDGQAGLLHQALLTDPDPRIFVGQGPAGGPGVARTLALARASGTLVRVLDADDLLMPGALARDIAALAEHPYATSAALDLLPSGSSTLPADPHPEGPLVRGSVLALWQRNGYTPPVHPATLCIRRDLLLALGGWMALPASEDTGLLIAANSVADGYHLAEPSLRYRRWPGQTTAQPAHADPDQRAHRVRIIELRAAALASLLP
jgi:glycosyltransferase involved in cell wall biosynthesis